jgi:hypothetical protein
MTWARIIFRNHHGTVTISIELSAAIVHCNVSASPTGSRGISLSLFRARCSSPAPLSNISSSSSFKNGTWVKWLMRQMIGLATIEWDRTDCVDETSFLTRPSQP